MSHHCWHGGQAAAVKSRGRERWSKSPRTTSGRCVLVRRTQVNPSKTRRYPENRRQNQERFDLLGPACREPDDWAGGDRRIGGVTPTQAFARNCGNQSLRWQGRSSSGENREARRNVSTTLIQPGLEFKLYCGASIQGR